MLSLALGACVSTRPVTTSTAHEGWPLLSPASLGESRTASQLLRIAQGQQEATLNCVLSVTADHINIVGTTALGFRAFTVKFDGAAVSAEAHPSVPQSMAPERLLNDVQLVYWPLSALKKALSNSSWDVSEPAPGTRRLKRDGKLVAEVHYASDAGRAWQGRAWLSNVEFDYTLTIDTASLTGDAQ